MTTVTPAATANIQLRDAQGTHVTVVQLPAGMVPPGVILWERRAFVKGTTGYTESDAWIDLTGDFVAAGKADVSSLLAEAHRLLLVIEGAPGKFRDDIRSLVQRLEHLFHRAKPAAPATPVAPPVAPPSAPPPPPSTAP